MPRPAKFDEGQILGAAASLVAARGPAAATMTAIKHALGAPSGSIYHRFGTRDELLAKLWLKSIRAFQDRWIEALAEHDPMDAGREAALSLPRQVRTDLDGARVALLYRREDFVLEGWPADIRTEAERLRRQVKQGLGEMTRRLFGHDTEAARRSTAFATIDLPYSAVRRYVAEGKSPPPHVDALIERAYAAIMNVERASGS